MKKNLSYLNYFYIMLVILWTPLQRTMITVDGAGRTLIFFTIFVMISNLPDKLSKYMAFSKPMVLWGILTIYSLINLSIEGYSSEDTGIMSFFIIQLFSPFLVMVVSARELVYGKRQTLLFLVGLFFVHGLLSLVGFGSELTDPELRANDSSVNILALNIIFLIFFSLLSYSNGYLKFKYVIIFAVLVFYVLFLTQTRKAFGACMIIFLLFVLSKRHFTLFARLKQIAIVSCSYFLLFTVFPKSFLGQRFLSIKEVGDNSNTTDFEILSLLGDRVYFYIDGFYLFLEKPLTGIGITNFSNLSRYEDILHSEYMTQLCENGLIGFSIFCCFYVALSKKLFSIKIKREEKYILVGGVSSILFIGITAWTYAFCQYFVVIGVVIGTCFLNRKKTNLSKNL